MEEQTYIYYKPGKLASDGIGDYWVFDRSIPTKHNEWAINHRVEELKSRGLEVMCSDKFEKGAFY